MNKKIWIFLAVCLGISFGAAALFYFLGGKYASIAGSLFASAYMFIPTISVIITQLICKEKVLSNVGLKFKINIWWLIALVAMPVLCIIATVASGLLPGVELSLDSELMQKSLEQLSNAGQPIGVWGFLGIELVSALFAGCTINAVFALGEEIAWRGFLPENMKEWGFWKKCLVIGFIWGFWHAPIILMGHNYPSHPVAGVFMMIAFCMLMTPIFLYFREKGNSVVTSAIAHGSLNAIAGIALLLLIGYNEMLCGMTGVIGFAVMAIADIFIYFKIRSAKVN